MEKQLKVVYSKKEPNNKHVVWLHPDAIHDVAVKIYNNGNWETLKTIDVPDYVIDKINEYKSEIAEYNKAVNAKLDNITNIANEANNTSKSVVETATTALTTSSNAVNTSNEAIKLSEEAFTMAREAKGESLSAMSSAQRAALSASQASASANSAKQSATEAATSAKEAVDTASDALQLVEEAKEQAQASASSALKAEQSALEAKEEASKVAQVERDVQKNTDDISNNTTRLDVLEGEGEGSVKNAVAEGIAQVVADAPDNLNTLKEIADFLTSDNNTSDILGELKNLRDKDIELSNNINANAEEIGLLAEAVETKAPKVGYAPDLKVDFAKELVGRGVAEPQEIGTIRPTGLISIGDGNATIEKIKGRSVVWNQRVNPTWSTTNSTIVKDGESIVVTMKSTSPAYYGVNIPTIAIPVNHKILLDIDTTITTNAHIYGIVGNLWRSQSVITVAKEKTYLRVYKEGTFAEGDSFTLHKCNIIDLTQMFGEGNEPTTIEEFEARKPLGVSNEYNEGEIISYDGANELKSVGFNAFNGTYAKVIGGQQYHATGTITSIGFTTELGGETTEVTLDSEGMFTPTEDGYVYAVGTDICIHLTHTYTPEHTTEYEEDILTLPDVKAIKDKDGNQLFPYGLLSAGSAHDEITATKAIKRVGVVDLGTLNWSRHLFTGINTFYYFRYANSDIANGAYLVYPNVLCKPYIRVTTDTNNLVDKSVTNFYNNNLLLVRDDAYTDVASFKEANKGVLLYYELAEPIEVDLPEPLNLTYDAWDFGTEELVAEGKTTPLNADIVYQFNAVDRIRENSDNLKTLTNQLGNINETLEKI